MVRVVVRLGLGATVRVREVELGRAGWLVERVGVDEERVLVGRELVRVLVELGRDVVVLDRELVGREAVDLEGLDWVRDRDWVREEVLD